MAEKEVAMTPMMRQFYDLKAKHPDAIMLFRCGDFYETYCDDAIWESPLPNVQMERPILLRLLRWRAFLFTLLIPICLSS